ANELLRIMAPCRAAGISQIINEEMQAREQDAAEHDQDDEPAAPAAEAPAAAPEASPEPQAAPEPGVLPFGPGTVNNRARRPGRAANRGQSRPVDPPRPPDRPSASGPDGGLYSGWPFFADGARTTPAPSPIDAHRRTARPSGCRAECPRTARPPPG